MSKNRKHFELESLKIKDGVVTVEYREFNTSDGVNGRWDDKTLECTVHPHPDLEDRFKRLNKYAMRVMGWMDIKSVLNSSMLTETEQRAAKDLRHTLKSFEEAQLERLEARGLHLSGKDETRGAIITIMRDSDSKTSSVINTPVIKFQREYFGIEEEFAALVDEIIDETFEYIFTGKQAQQSLDFDLESAPKSKKKGKKKDPNQADLVEQSEELSGEQ